MCTVPIDSEIGTLLPSLTSGVDVQLRPREVLIHAPGFEDRTLAVTCMVRAPTRGHAILLEFRPYDEANQLDEVRSRLRNRGFIVDRGDILEYNRFDPGDFEHRLECHLRSLGVDGALVDISTMSKLEIILVLKVCVDMGLRVRVRYSEAESYGPTETKFKRAIHEGIVRRPSLQVFSGIHGVVRVSSLSSIAMQGHTTAALVFMSFNDSLTQILLNTIYPGKLFLINGRPPEQSWRESATAWIHDQVRKEWEEDNPSTEVEGSLVPLPDRKVSTLDYRETVCLLISLYWQLSTSHRILLAPAGSKMQSVGCYMVKALHPDIHIEYPSPEGFQSSYSEGIGSQWLLDFGDFWDLISKVGRAEQGWFLEIG